MPSHLHPRTAGEILDGAFVLYRRHFVRLALPVVLYLAPVVLLVGVVATSGPEPTGLEMLAVLLLFVWGVAGALFTWAALTRVASQAFDGAAPSLKDGFRSGLRAVLPLLGAGFLINVASNVLILGVLVIFGLLQFTLALLFGERAYLLLFVPVTFVGTFGVTLAFFAAHFAVVPAVVIERAGPVSSILRSWRLARRGWLRIIGVSLVSWIIVLLPLFGVGAATGLLDALASAGGTAPTEPPVALVLGAVLVAALAGPFFVLSSVLLYYDQRFRGEGLDLELAAERLPAPA